MELKKVVILFGARCLLVTTLSQSPSQQPCCVEFCSRSLDALNFFWSQVTGKTYKTWVKWGTSTQMSLGSPQSWSGLTKLPGETGKRELVRRGGPGPPCPYCTHPPQTFLLDCCSCLKSLLTPLWANVLHCVLTCQITTVKKLAEVTPSGFEGLREFQLEINIPARHLGWRLLALKWLRRVKPDSYWGLNILAGVWLPKISKNPEK